MIAVDTSAIMAVLLGESSKKKVMTCLAENTLCISAGTLSELYIVAAARGLMDELDDLIAALGVEIVAVDGGTAKRVQNAFLQWGKGRHKAALNFGDCFAYVLARERDVPLLFVGDDFARTDIDNVIQ